MPTPRGHNGPPPADAARADPTPPTIAEVVDRIYERYDADASGTLTLTELLSVIDPDGTRTEAAERAAEALSAIDTDADRALGEAEVTAIVTRLDTDGDGTLERSDRSADGADDDAFDAASVLLFARASRGGPDGGGRGERSVTDAVDALLARYDADDSTTIALSELLAALDPKGTRSELEDTVTSLYASIDTDGNALLSQAELTTAVARLDADGDGVLERGEHPGADAGDAVQLIGILLHGGHGPHGAGPDGTGAP